MADKFNVVDQGSIVVDPEGTPLKGLRGEALTYIKDPFLNNEEECYKHYQDALIVIQGTTIVDVGEYVDIAPKYPQLKPECIEVYKDSIIMPGFIDCHVHYVQSPMIGSFGQDLLGWLDKYTFPCEEQFKNKSFADETAKIFFEELLQQGTTTANIFATTFEESVDAIFEESERYNTRCISGKVLQDRNLPTALADSNADEAIVLAEKLLKKWHHRGRQLYAVVPRFAPTSTDRQLELCGQLYQRYLEDGVYMHTHLDEAVSEVEWISQLYPDIANYTEVYNKYGLVDKHSIFAHCCLCREEEWQVLHDKKSGVAHCPSSNLFLADGEFKWWEAKKPERPVRVGMGTDVGGGTNFSILRQLNEAYKVGMLQNKALNSLHTFYLATRGGAETLHLENMIGSLAPGYEADITVINFKPSKFIEWRMKFCKTLWEKLFVVQTLALNDTHIATYVAGNKVFDRFRDKQFMYASDFEKIDK